VHVQNVDTWEAYVEKLGRGELPLGRALPTTRRDRLIREIVLLLKTGHLDVGYFRKKYGADIRDEFRTQFARLAEDGWLTVTGESIDCTRDGLLQIDRHLPVFFDPQYRGPRYT
jgi:oxygen-independent coproporphyrinogen-3 oxidase